ncbi:hypothetical protein YC2023_055478 [Brassica napus]
MSPRALLGGVWVPRDGACLQPPPIRKMAVKLAKNPGFLTRFVFSGRTDF